MNNLPESDPSHSSPAQQGYRLILASASPRRRELLDQVGLRYMIQPADVDEAIAPDDPLLTSPGQLVIELARRKAQAVADLRSPKPLSAAAEVPAISEIVLGCDTLVFLDDRPLGKPRNADETREFLRQLSGRTHTVRSGVCLITQADNTQALTLTGQSATRVHIRALTEAMIDDYLAAGESADKAGGYAIQGRAAFFVTGIEGDYSNVVGLPLALLFSMLGELGAHPLRPKSFAPTNASE